MNSTFEAGQISRILQEEMQGAAAPAIPLETDVHRPNMAGSQRLAHMDVYAITTVPLAEYHLDACAAIAATAQCCPRTFWLF